MPTSTTRSTSHYLATNRGVLDALVGLQMASRSRGAVADVDLVNIDDDGDDLVDLTDVEAPLEAPITPGVLVPAG
jgi:hypothetical protein